MTKDVLVSISGIHDSIYDASGTDDNKEPIEIITPATYYFKNGKHYVIYDEVVEGVSGVIRNKIRIAENETLEIMKSGITDTHMTFEKDRMNVTQYKTPYGEMLVGTQTHCMETLVEENKIHVKVGYSLDIDQEKVADCEIVIKIKALER